MLDLSCTSAVVFNSQIDFCWCGFRRYEVRVAMFNIVANANADIYF